MTSNLGQNSGHDVIVGSHGISVLPSIFACKSLADEYARSRSMLVVSGRRCRMIEAGIIAPISCPCLRLFMLDL
jgi:hypothetical protein